MPQEYKTHGVKLGEAVEFVAPSGPTVAILMHIWDAPNGLVAVMVCEPPDPPVRALREIARVAGTVVETNTSTPLGNLLEAAPVIVPKYEAQAVEESDSADSAEAPTPITPKPSTPSTPSTPYEGRAYMTNAVYSDGGEVRTWRALPIPSR